MPDNTRRYDDDDDDRDSRRSRHRDDDDENGREVNRRRSRDDDEEEDELPRRRRRRYEEDDDDDERPRRRRSRFPVLVSVAGWFWIGYGALFLLGTILYVIGVLPNQMKGNQQADANAQATGMICGFVFAGLIGAAFARAGIQSINGTAKDTMGNGIGSICFSLLYLAVGALSIGLKGGPLVGIVVMIFGGGLLAAGIMAIMGRGDYLDWRRENRTRGRSSKRYFRQEDDD